MNLQVSYNLRIFNLPHERQNKSQIIYGYVKLNSLASVANNTNHKTLRMFCMLKFRVQILARRLLMLSEHFRVPPQFLHTGLAETAFLGCPLQFVIRNHPVFWRYTNWTTRQSSNKQQEWKGMWDPHGAGFEITRFWDVTPCNLVHRKQCLEENCCLNFYPENEGKNFGPKP
jgi:hypothetical protein